ncbi:MULTISPECIES: DUF4326 domain-containing protein [Nocardia]|uniref:DUF4326 domain-containing protein n=1 Tax=Nocardia TaxID=1817 RepID=UPI000D69972A|nr:MULTISPECIES: DUF4326 domain-containing protein [Nocardia]
MPSRIQRSRKKGWRMPKGAIYVGRPTAWGNPFAVGEFYVNRGPWSRTAPYPRSGPEQEPRLRTDGFGRPYEEFVAKVRDRAHAVELFTAHISYEDVGVWDPKEIRYWLGDSDLVCWCPLAEPCHADLLLHIAAGGEI